MRSILVSIIFCVLLTSGCTTYYDVHTQAEFNNLAKDYKYIVRVQRPDSIMDTGIGESIQSYAQTAADNTLDSATKLAMSLCDPSCIVSSINGVVTEEAKVHIEKAKKLKVEREIAAMKKKQKEIEDRNNELAKIKDYSDKELCSKIISNNGGFAQHWLDNYDIWNAEQKKRNLTDYNCNNLTGIYTDDQKKALAKIEADKKAEQKSIELKQKKIILMKEDCKELGFKDGTEAMGNCVLKLMELQGNNAPTIVTTTTSSSSQEIVDIEKQKLQAQREALKLQQDQLKAEQERVAQERRRDRKKAADQLIQTGNCLMSGGGWGC